MRQLSAETRLHFPRARSLFRRASQSVQTFALYSSLALIVAVLLGSLSIHPF